MKDFSLEESLKRTNYRPNLTVIRVKIVVPFQDKDQAKALGAKWDGDLKTWYVPPDKDLNKFRRWLP